VETIDKIRNKSMCSKGWRGQFLARKKSGTFWNCHLAISAFKVEDTQIGYIAILRDISYMASGMFYKGADYNVGKIAQFTLMYGLAKLAECRDPETGYHLDRIERYSSIIAQSLRKNPKYENCITDDFVETLSFSSPLHDIGKVGIPDSILQKKGALTDDEFQIMKQHSIIGGDVLKITEEKNPSINNLKMARMIAYEHHEKFDGSGYPHKWKGDQISLPARIVAIADSYDCITSKRVYKEAESHEIALHKIDIDSGKHFDPDIVEAFMMSKDEILVVKNNFSQYRNHL
jgi:putative two-component system response regulator